MSIEKLPCGAVLHCGDCLVVLRTIPDASIDSIVTDPPYGLEFMGKECDGADGFRRSLNDADIGRDNAFGRHSARGPEYRAGHLFQTWCEAWAIECLRVLKPGGHMIAFGGTRTYHRLVCGIEDAGFEIRDQVAWTYGSEFPKSHNVSKAIDSAAGAEREVIGSKPDRWTGAGSVLNFSTDRPQETVVVYGDPATDAAIQWQGWGTALKPAWEPIVLARKPLIGTVAENVVKHGTGALNIDGCRVPCVEAPVDRADEATADRRYTEEGGTNFAAKPGMRRGRPARSNERSASGLTGEGGAVTFGKFAVRGSIAVGETTEGRWPANIIHDGSDEVVSAFPETASGAMKRDVDGYEGDSITSFLRGRSGPGNQHGDSGSAARFFYSAKADDDDRLGSKHPTVKPVDLMAYLVRLITPPAGTVLDPFAGTGTTGEGAFREGMQSILIERDPEYQDDIRRRMDLASAGRRQRKTETAKAKARGKIDDHGSLFAGFTNID